MASKKNYTEFFPWDYHLGEDNYHKEPWILKKGKEYVTIEKNQDNKGFFYVQKNEERRLSLDSLQIKSTYNQLLEFGYKLRKIKI